MMASGDAQKVWFPELIAIVKQAGKPALSMDALLRLRDRLDATLQTIRQTRQILPAMMGYVRSACVFSRKAVYLYITDGCRHLRRWPDGRIYP